MATSADQDIPFVERIKLAQQEQRVNYAKRQEEQKRRARVILDTVDAFVDDIMLVAQEKYIRGIHESDPNTKRQTVQLWEFSITPRNKSGQKGQNERIAAVGAEGVDFYTPFILGHGYKRLCEAHYPEENKSVADKLQAQFETSNFNDGIDPLTGEKLHICVFTKKGSRSVFKNGIVLSRDGVKYDEEHIPNRTRDNEETRRNTSRGY